MNHPSFQEKPVTYPKSANNEASEVVRLATGPATEVRLKRSEISGLTEGMMSLMPPGFDGVLAPGELADLVAYLQVLR